MSTVVLLDNGSSRADSTLSLRRLAAELGARIAEPVHPVSLLHSDKVPLDSLGGRAAGTLEPFLRAQAAEGSRDFLVLPLFFGRSRALTGFIPEKASEIGAEFRHIEVRVADVLYPLPQGEPRLAKILYDKVAEAARTHGVGPSRIVLVDHGSPLAEVTAVRRALAADLRSMLGASVSLDEAVMERRPGAEYDFNGDLLDKVLRRIASDEPEATVLLSMLFMSAGRHAGPGGDIEQICRGVEHDFPRLRVYATDLVGSHPALLDILQSRYEDIALHGTAVTTSR